jgi:hypothetical protein
VTESKIATGPVQVKDQDRGEVSAVIATIGVIDSDGDYTVDGAFTAGEQVDVSAFGHSIYRGDPPAGEGVLRVQGREAVVDMRLYMDTTRGRDTFNLIRARGAKQQWSYGYDVLNPRESMTVNGQTANVLRSLRVNEASPVWRGAGHNTRTLGVKLDDDQAQQDAQWEYLRFLDFQLKDLRQWRDDLRELVEREEAAAIRDRMDRVDVLKIRAALL